MTDFFNTQDKPVFTTGTSTFVAGAVTIPNTLVTATSKVFITPTNTGIVNLGTPTISAVVAGTSFSVKSSNALDTSTFNYMIVG